MQAASLRSPALVELPVDLPVDLLEMDRQGLRAWFAQRGERPFRADQVFKWVHRRAVTDFEAMTDLAKALRARLREEARIGLPEVVARRVSPDGTRKWVLRLADGNAIETVFIPEEGRGTLCISSQVGCALGCRFCATARQGWSRDLSTGEILAQLVVAHRELGDTPAGGRPVTNVVLMGMGEPLLNYERVLPALRVLVDDLGYGISRRRVTVSTAGVVPAIDRLREDCPVSLAVSLHAPDDALRDRLVPINRKYPIAELLAACRRYSASGPHRAITFEYVLLEGVNDREEDARALARLLRGLPAKVNLIPFNPFPGAPWRAPAPERVDRFRERLLAAGLLTITRKRRGERIDAACGQLVGKVLPRSRRAARGAAAPGPFEGPAQVPG